MKILHIFKTYYPDTIGGIERVMRELCEGLARVYELDIYVLTTAVRKSDIYESRDNPLIVRIPRLTNFGSTPLPFPGAFRREYKRLLSMVDIVHYHFPWPVADLYDLLINRNPKIPIVVTYQSDIVRQKLLLRLYMPLLSRFLEKTDVIVATSENYINSSAVLQENIDHVKMIPNGLPESIVGDEIVLLREKFISNHGENYLLFVGVPRYYKGIGVLIEASKNAPYKVIIAGHGGDIELLKEKAKKMKVENVIFLGKVEENEKIALMIGSTAVVLPSTHRSEAYGLVLVEAASLGVPMISTSLVTGTSWINQQNVTGIVVPPNDAKCLRAAMNALYADRKRAEEMGRAAKIRYEKLFSAKKMLSEYAALYHSVLANAH